MASYFLEAGNLNGSNADMRFDVAGPSTSGTGDLFELSESSNETIILLFPPLLALMAAILDLSVTTTPTLPSGCVTSSCIRSIYAMSRATFPPSCLTFNQSERDW